MVQKQTLYLAVLISVTAGFLAGSAYTSFKLADPGRPVPGQAAPHDPRENDTAVSAKAEARILKLEQHLRENPEDAPAWTELGNLYFDADQPVQAIESYKKSLALNPSSPGVLTDMGVMYRRTGRPERAVEAFDQAIQADPFFETAFFNKGIVLMHDLKDLKAALRAWEDLTKINPSARTPGGESVKDLIFRMRSQENQVREKQ